MADLPTSPANRFQGMLIVMNDENPNYRPNALSRFYATIGAGAGKLWTALGWAPRNYPA